MNGLTPSGVLALTEVEVRQHFESWVANEQGKGLTDIKFALAADGMSTVSDVMRQILFVELLRSKNELTVFQD